MNTYGTESDSSGSNTVEVGIAEYVVTDGGEVVSTYGLGSCVAIALFDVESDVAGLAHIMLPSAEDSNDDTVGKFADTAVRAMLAEMDELGATRAHVRAKIAGGSEMFDFTGIAEGVGKRNVEAARRELRAQGIPIDGENVGGNHGRSIKFDTGTGTMTLKTADDGETEL